MDPGHMLHQRSPMHRVGMHGVTNRDTYVSVNDFDQLCGLCVSMDQTPETNMYRNETSE